MILLAYIPDTLINSSGCDSIVTIDLTINTSDTSYTNINACNSSFGMVLIF